VCGDCFFIAGYEGSSIAGHGWARHGERGAGTAGTPLLSFLSSSSPSAPPVSPSQTLAATASSSPLTCMLGFDAENKSFLLTLSP
jgi:hypothetical protein